jgi:hypothetical protein
MDVEFHVRKTPLAVNFNFHDVSHFQSFRCHWGVECLIFHHGVFLLILGVGTSIRETNVPLFSKSDVAIAFEGNLSTLFGNELPKVN